VAPALLILKTTQGMGRMAAMANKSSGRRCIRKIFRTAVSIMLLFALDTLLPEHSEANGASEWEGLIHSFPKIRPACHFYFKKDF
jgi:hypothetical protein